MRVLEDTLLLAAPSFRSRAYAQRLSSVGLLPSAVLAIAGDEPVWDGPPEVKVDLKGTGKEIVFHPGISARTTLAEAGVPITVASKTDINSESFVRQLSGSSQTVVLYSGPGGVLLREPLLASGKRFLHIHGGYAPEFRGSTAFYYSILRDGSIGATALWLAKDIDAGPILARTRYPAPRGVEIDRVVDPLARADLLAQVLEERWSSGIWPEGSIDHQGAETYHVIHPVLKHIALRRCDLVPDCESPC